MKLLRFMLLSACLAFPSFAGTIAQMQFISDDAGSGVFIFSVDGEYWNLFCHQFLPNATTLPYEANVATLADLTGTVLQLQGDPNALKKYQQVAILDLYALANPSSAVDAVRASRRIIDGSGPLVPAAQALFDWVQTQDPTKYDLSGFRIFTNLRTQEIGGFDPGFDLVDVPEPSAMVLLGSGLAGLLLLRRRR